MKQFLIILVILFNISMPVAKAQVPDGVLGFSDGKYYTEESSKTGVPDYLCFLDNKCYNKEMKFAFNRGNVAGESISEPVTNKHTLLSIPFQWFPRTLDDLDMPSTLNNVICKNNINGSVVTLQCTNGSTEEIKVKQILFTAIPVRYNDDYQSVTDNIHIYDSNENILNFNSSVNNTLVMGNYAKAVYTLSPEISITKTDPLKGTNTAIIIKAFNTYPYLVLFSSNGKDVVVKVN